jgi:hypothetical protein
MSIGFQIFHAETHPSADEAQRRAQSRCLEMVGVVFARSLGRLENDSVGMAGMGHRSWPRFKEKPPHNISL